MENQPEKATRSVFKYRGEKLYVVVTDKSISLSMANNDNHLTLSGLGLVERLITACLESGEDVETMCLETSCHGNSLPALIKQAMGNHLRKI